MLAACGGSASTTTKPHSGSRPIRLFTVALSGHAEVAKGAPKGRGVADIAFHGESQVSWRFSHLHGFTDATVAHIHAGRAGRSGPVAVSLSHGPRLHHKGCVAVSPALTRALWADPPGYYVNIHSTAYPNGAVRGQL